VAFPGGHFEPDHDESLVDTAIRETCEEVGVRLYRRELLGTLPRISPLSPVRVNAHSLVVSPFVFAVRASSDSVRERDVDGDVPRSGFASEASGWQGNREIDQMFWVPLQRLAESLVQSARNRQRASGHSMVPDGLPHIWLRDGAPPLWGMTYRVTEILVDVLTASNAADSAIADDVAESVADHR